MGENFEVNDCFKKCPTNQEPYEEWGDWSKCDSKEVYCSRKRECLHKSCFGKFQHTSKCVTKKDENNSFKRVCRGEIIDHPTWLVGKMMGSKWLKIFLDYNKRLNDSFVLDWEDDLLKVAKLAVTDKTAENILKNIIVSVLIIVSTYCVLGSGFFFMLFIYIKKFLGIVISELIYKADNFNVNNEDENERTPLLN